MAIRRHTINLKFEMRFDLPAGRGERDPLIQRLRAVAAGLEHGFGAEADGTLTIEAIETLERLAAITRRARASMPKDKR